MRRSIGKSFGNLATVGLLVLTLLSVGLSGLALPALVGSHSGGLATSAAPRAAHVDPAVGPVSASITITNPPAAYLLLPYTLTWNVSVTNATIAPGNTWISIAVNQIAGRCVQHLTCVNIVNLSATDQVASGKTSYSYTMIAANVTANGALAQAQFQIIVWMTINNTVSNHSFGSSISRFVVTNAPTGSFVAPSPGASISTGNVTIGVNYTGSYLSGVQVTVYQGTSTAGKLVFTQGAFVPGGGLQIVILASVWYVSTPGTYTAVLNISAPYGTYVFPMTWTVIPAGQVVYQNTSSWSNASVVPGLAPAVGGTVLLVVGLIVGMIVALALGRSMWGSPKPGPAQAWQAKAGTNECSVCHQTFATEAELKEHAKTAHGM